MNSDQLSKKNTRSKRKCILDGAVQVFTKAGFDAASMDKIAETAGVSKITIYKYFQNKETLFLAVVTEYLKENEAHKPVSYSPSQTIESQLHAFIQAELFRVKDEKQRGMSKLLTSVYLYKTELVKKTMQEHPFFTDFIAWMKMAKQDGKISCSSEVTAAQLFYGMIHGCLTWNALLTDGASLQEADGLAEEIIMTFLTRYGA